MNKNIKTDGVGTASDDFYALHTELPSEEVEEEGAQLAYGLYIMLDGPSALAIRNALMAPAHKKVEVAVKFNHITREFTFKDFLERLGFEYTPDSLLSP